MRFPLLMSGTLLVLLALPACASSSEVSQPPVPESAAPTPSPAVPEDPAPDDPTSRDSDPQIVAPCEAMPAQRPDGGRLTYRLRGRDPVDLRRFNLVAAGDECPGDDLAPHLRPVSPPPECIQMDGRRIDELWATLTNEHFRQVRTSTIEASPHRGGQALGAVWGPNPGDRCTVRDVHTSQVLEPDADFLRASVEIVRRAMTEAQSGGARRLAVVPQLGMRTVQRRPTLGLRLDNGRTTGARLRVLTAAPLDDAGAPGPEVAISQLEVSNVPFRGVYPATDTTASSPRTWIDVSPETSRLVELTVDHRARHSFGATHRYRVVVEHEGSGEETVEVTINDAIRHPRNPSR